MIICKTKAISIVFIIFYEKIQFRLIYVIQSSLWIKIVFAIFYLLLLFVLFLKYLNMYIIHVIYNCDCTNIDVTKISYASLISPRNIKLYFMTKPDGHFLFPILYISEKKNQWFSYELKVAIELCFVKSFFLKNCLLIHQKHIGVLRFRTCNCFAMITLHSNAC